MRHALDPALCNASRETQAMTPILMLGAGRMGGAMIAGWRRAGAFASGELILRDPHPGEAAIAAQAAGAVLNPGADILRTARTVVLAVKPQVWRDVALEIVGDLAADAVLVSVAAGITTQALAEVFGDRAVARAMPTTAAAIGQGTTSLFATGPEALGAARSLFAPLGTVVELESEDLMHAATAVSGSAPAYLYAFVEALAAAGVTAGLSPEAAGHLARSTLAGAAALMAESPDTPAALRQQVTSPGGTTEAALRVLVGTGGLDGLLDQAVKAAVARSKALGK